MRARILLGAFFLALPGTPSLVAAESTETGAVVVVAHPEIEVTTISRLELSKIFLGRLRTWSDGARVRPVDQRPDSTARADFTRWIHGRSVVTIEVYWKRMIFSGRGVPPPEVANEREVLEYVQTTPGAVGYVTRSEIQEGVKEVQVTD